MPLLLLLAAALAAPAPDAPIVIRHDRADAQYLALGARYPAVGTVGGGDGTLVAPTWVLTAAHVARGLQRRSVPPAVRFGGRAYAVAEVVLHPDWADMGPHDLALLRLAEPVEGIAPLALYDGDAEVGAVATLVGHGDTRTGRGGDWVADGRRRGATNRVDGVEGSWLVVTFDEPPAATDLEGTPGRGDSGGPALLTVDGAPVVAGVSSLGVDGRHGPGTYGAVDHFVRVSAHLDWLRATMASPLVEGVAVAVGAQPAAVELPATPAGAHLAAFLALDADDDAALLAFVRARVSASGLAERPAEARLPGWRALAADVRGATVRHVVRSSAADVEVILAHPGGPETVLRFRCEPMPPHGIEAVFTGRID